MTAIFYVLSESCIKGHRSSSCTHTERPLYEIKKKGRPVSQCERCRQLRNTKRVHSKCTCSEGSAHQPREVTDKVFGKKRLFFSRLYHVYLSCTSLFQRSVIFLLSRHYLTVSTMSSPLQVRPQLPPLTHARKVCSIARYPLCLALTYLSSVDCLSRSFLLAKPLPMR